MSYGRLIKPDLIESPDFLRLSEGAQLWIMKMIVFADYFGRGCADGPYLLARLSPRCSLGAEEAEKRISELKASRIVVFYREEELNCYYFPAWFSIQRFNSNCYPTPTKFPWPPNPPLAYVDGCEMHCRTMLRKNLGDPDEYVDMTSVFDPDWRDRDDSPGGRSARRPERTRLQ